MKSFQYTETKYVLTVQETAKVLGISVHTVYRLIRSGQLSAVKISPRKTVIKAEELERYKAGFMRVSALASKVTETEKFAAYDCSPNKI